MPRYSKSAASLFLFLAIAFDGYHSLIARTPWAGYGLGMNYSSVLLIPLLVAAIAGIYSELAALTPMIVFGLFALLAHGVFVAEGGDRMAGLLFMGLSVLSSVATGGLLFGKLLNSNALVPANVKPNRAPVKVA